MFSRMATMPPTDRKDCFTKLERQLSSEARDILSGMITQCLDVCPSQRPTSKELLEALGIYNRLN